MSGDRPDEQSRRSLLYESWLRQELQRLVAVTLKDDAADYNIALSQEIDATFVSTNKQHILVQLKAGAGKTFILNEVLMGARADGEMVPPNREPPAVAEFLLRLFAQTRHQSAVLGDLNETFFRNCEQYGRSRATRLYWADALHSLWSLFVRTLGRLIKWTAIADAIKRHLLS
jgi:hypothetical protein